MDRCCLTAAIAVLWLSQMPLSEESPRSYVAAVYEHQVILNSNPGVPLGRRAALEHMKKNLDVFEEQATLAVQQGAQIIVFPEDAIHGFNYTRASIAGYLERVPDPRVVTWSPCAEPARFPDTEVLQRLSCMAQKNSLYVVANMPGRQPCDRATDAHCPPDGHYQFNTDVVFSDSGAVVARYHKQNLYFEAAFDTPPECQRITFATPFAGRFGVFTCFDILFRDPAVTLVEEMGVRQLVYPTAWMNQLPLLAAVQFQRAFSYAAGVTLLAANVQAAGLGMTGSGIFTPWDALYHHDAQGEGGRLLVGTVPVLDPAEMGDNAANSGLALVPFAGHTEHESGSEEPEAKGWLWSGGCTRPGSLGSEQCLEGAQGCGEETTPFTSTMMYDNFTLVALQGSEGNLSVCDGSLCCHLLFRRSLVPRPELYALGAFQGLHVVHGTYYLEVCALVRCAGDDYGSCGGEIEHSKTRVDFRLEGTFSGRHVYPGVLGSGMTLDRPDKSGWVSDSRFYMSRAGMPSGLVTAMLYGRVYGRDGG